MSIFKNMKSGALKEFIKSWTISLREFEEWFWDYYDTDLFRTKIWDYIEKSEANLIKFERIFERVLGVGKWEYAFW